MIRYEEGQAAHAEGKQLVDNPHESGADMTDWAAGWHDAQAEAADVPADETEETDTPPGDAGTQEDTPNAEGADEIEEVVATEVVASLGDVGYERIMELLTNPPVEDIVPGTLPDNGEVPDDLREWLEAWKAPLAFVAVDTALSAVKTRLTNTSRGRLKELYRGMSPLAMAAAMQSNAAVVAEFAEQRVAEAGLINSLQTSVTQKAAGYLLNALLLV